MGRCRRKTAIIAVTFVVVIAGLTGAYLFHRFEAGVTRRRAASAAVAAAQARKQHDADIRLCEVAINAQNANLRGLIGALTMAAPAPATPAEAAARAASAEIFSRFLAPIDCEVFVATGRLIPTTNQGGPTTP
jgi:hypothetical protein